jgi:hypothetical protein
MFRAVQLYDQFLIGREEKKYEITQALLRESMSDGKIAAITGLAESVVADLRANPPEQEKETAI